MSQEVRIPLRLRLMAGLCRICPCCVIARRWPESGFAKAFESVRHHCPFCRAYEKVRHIRIMAGAEAEQRMPVSKVRQEPF